MNRRAFLHWSSLAAVAAGILVAEAVVTPTDVINLLDDSGFENWTHHLNPDRSLTEEREEIWYIDDEGVLQVTGKGWGYLRTNTAYRDYHLIMEYKWGEHTVGFREDRARDNGLFVHAFGEDGLLLNSWISSIEAQLIEGGSGDLLVLAPTDKDGDPMPTRMSARVRRDRDGEPVWFADGSAESFPPEGRRAARVNWLDRDPDWRDEKGFRGKKDIENPVGEWNRLEVICRNEVVSIYINGHLVNGAFDVYPTEGYICIQSEGAWLSVRRWELWPLDQYNEPWEERVGSTNMGASETGESLLPRRFPWSPEKSQTAWQIDGDYEIQLVAAEPLVNDPVDVVWDEFGRMFVVEMRDYPTPTENGPLMSRIRLLKDTDKDGRMDESTTWMDKMDHVQGRVAQRLLNTEGFLL